jgi:membrane-bound inhibitor of C-type lysozyme
MEKDKGKDESPFYWKALQLSQGISKSGFDYMIECLPVWQGGKERSISVEKNSRKKQWI